MLTLRRARVPVAPLPAALVHSPADPLVPSAFRDLPIEGERFRRSRGKKPRRLRPSG